MLLLWEMTGLVNKTIHDSYEENLKYQRHAKPATVKGKGEE